MARFKVGLHYYQQHTTMKDLRQLWPRADAMGVDSIWPWDQADSGGDTGIIIGVVALLAVVGIAVAIGSRHRRVMEDTDTGATTAAQ